VLALALALALVLVLVLVLALTPYAAAPCPAGTSSRSQIEDTYAISRRIEAEERALDSAVIVFTSTQQEVDDQWGLYDG
jgi:hypothetical protein